MYSSSQVMTNVMTKCLVLVIIIPGFVVWVEVSIIGESDINEPQVIPELCGKYVQHFFAGYDFVLGLTKDNKVYGWGENNFGQLGRSISKGNPSNIFLKPEIINLPSVIQLSCGSCHTLALTCDGRVFGWGDNIWGQIVCGGAKNITKPIHLKTFKQFSVKLLKTSVNSSYALTVDGLVYKWGDYCSLGHGSNRDECVCAPMLITNTPKMSMICPLEWKDQTLVYLLSNDRDIYICQFKRRTRDEYKDNDECTGRKNCSIYKKNNRNFKADDGSLVKYFEKIIRSQSGFYEKTGSPKMLFNFGIKFSSLHLSGHDNHITAVSDDGVYVSSSIPPPTHHVVGKPIQKNFGYFSY